MRSKSSSIYLMQDDLRNAKRIFRIYVTAQEETRREIVLMAGLGADEGDWRISGNSDTAAASSYKDFDNRETALFRRTDPGDRTICRRNREPLVGEKSTDRNRNRG